MLWIWTLLYWMDGLDAYISKNLEHLESGDLSSFDDLFQIAGFNNPSAATGHQKPPKQPVLSILDISLKSVSQHDHLFKDFEDISNLIPEDIIQYKLPQVKVQRRLNYFISEKSETARRGVMRNMSYAWIPHIRHRVARAMALRQNVRSDKRFQLGYLFNKLRYIRINQRKLIHTARRLIQHDTRNALMSVGRLYQKMQHLDIDIKDMQVHIKTVFSVKMPYDEVVPKGPGSGPKKPNRPKKG